MTSAPALTARGILLNCTASSREEAVRLCGQALLDCGAIEQPYVEAMWERELIMSSYIGEATAIPHGTDLSRKYVNFAQLVFLRFRDVVDWEGEKVRLAIGIASANDDHVDTLGVIAEILMDDELRSTVFESNDPEEIINLVQKAFEKK
ncbi:MAG: hypothetical protein RIR66_264 [Actinomycetota bacterium]|jgi:mannitol/fructose-specific phosphotransferase system IIA component